MFKEHGMKRNKYRTLSHVYYLSRSKYDWLATKVLSRQTFVFRVRISQRQILFQYIISARSTPSIESKMQTLRISFEPLFDSSDSSPFPIFPPPPPFSPFDHPLKKPTPDHVRITISSSPLLFGRERSCLPSHTIDVPFRRASDLFLPFSFFLPPLLSSYITIYIPHAWSLRKEGRRDVGCYNRKKSYGLDNAVCDSASE